MYKCNPPQYVHQNLTVIYDVFNCDKFVWYQPSHSYLHLPIPIVMDTYIPMVLTQYLQLQIVLFEYLKLQIVLSQSVILTPTYIGLFLSMCPCIIFPSFQSLSCYQVAAKTLSTFFLFSSSRFRSRKCSARSCT